MISSRIVPVVLPFYRGAYSTCKCYFIFQTDRNPAGYKTFGGMDQGVVPGNLCIQE